MIIDRLDHEIGDGFAMLAHDETVGQLRRDMLQNRLASAVRAARACRRVWRE